MKFNPITACDFYKISHLRFYPKGTELVYSNFTPRTTKHFPKVDGTDQKIVFFGLQYYLKWFVLDVLQKNFFEQPRATIVADFKRRCDMALGVDLVGTEHIERLHELGYLPVSFRALPEGATVNEGVPVLTIENTKPEFFWVTNYLETSLSCMLWKMCNSATVARRYNQIGREFAEKTGGDLNFIKWQFHDFSFRGMGGIQDAMMSGAAHLTNFYGSDTISGADLLEEYYGADPSKEILIGSVPASEHSCVSLGTKEGEFESFQYHLTESYPTGIVSLVSDTWDFFRVLTEYLPRLKEQILSRNGKLVIRPDSSPKTPYEIICGDEEAPEGSPERLGAVRILWNIFGGKTNSKGFKELDSHIGLIYGEQISPELARNIFLGLERLGFCSTNVVFGVGSFSYTYCTRDTLGFAMKATAGIVNGEVREIFKAPKTDKGLKKSARGFLAVRKNSLGKYQLFDQVSREESQNRSELKEVFRDGKLLVNHLLPEIRHRINESL